MFTVKPESLDSNLDLSSEAQELWKRASHMTKCLNFTEIQFTHNNY